MHLYLLVDCSNFRNLKSAFIRDLLCTWLGKILDDKISTYQVTIRLYGGWYTNGITNNDRYQAVAYYQKHCPTVLKIRNIIVRLKVVFADYIFDACPNKEEYRIDNTTQIRTSKLRYKFVNTINCTSPQCGLTEIRKWMKNNKACSNTNCRCTFKDVFERVEQKQVDSHLISDAFSIYFKEDPYHIAIASSDVDFVPLFLSFINMGYFKLTSIRWAKDSWYADSFLGENNVQLVEVNNV